MPSRYSSIAPIFASAPCPCFYSPPRVSAYIKANVPLPPVGLFFITPPYCGHPPPTLLAPLRTFFLTYRFALHVSSGYPNFTLVADCYTFFIVPSISLLYFLRQIFVEGVNLFFFFLSSPVAFLCHPTRFINPCGGIPPPPFSVLSDAHSTHTYYNLFPPWIPDMQRLRGPFH